MAAEVSVLKGCKTQIGYLHPKRLQFDHNRKGGQHLEKVDIMSRINLANLTSKLIKLVLNEEVVAPQMHNNIRQFHSTPSLLKNFSSRIPKNTKIGLWRFESHVDPSKYTLTPLKVAKTGGRGPDGRIWVHKIGGGDKVVYRMRDMKREGPKDSEPLAERVNAVMKDETRSAHLAVIAGGNKKRYIVASENMKPGDIIKTSGKISAMPVRASEGDAHPVGSLPLGTLVHCIERFPGEGATVATAAGTFGVYLRRIGDKCVIRMPSKREMVVSQECMVTVGRVSNIDHHKTKKMTKAGDNRRRGKRPNSGWWQRKTGYHGRKIRPMRPPMVYEKPSEEKPEVFRYTL
ncbi:50S ribosomal protein l2 [Plakobranchus ocellatus]|uniref:50S ribosomal protein l2 n=1 Tax=Plakobranchus ocellatus TaxID=259542 RepID=A0AAV4BIL0_9GAST|nr:50S ribosomal protein l2 [Plakobranchus ocellatus]